MMPLHIQKNTANVAPPRARPIQYKAPLGTRWEKEKANAAKGAFEFNSDPDTIGPWILGECVGKGASGRVRVARHSETGQMAAVKILPLEAVISSRLSMRSRLNKAEKHRNGIDKEIIMMKLMDHPNIVRIFDVFEGENELFLVLDYVDGGELFDYLVNHGRMEPMKGLCYFKQIIYGLSYAHAFSIIHRDLKPENILIASLNPPHIKIADWGMAAFAPPERHLETSCGSPHYASPEVVRGERYSGTATDIWSCGVILFALMTGRLPFDDKNLKTLLQKVKSGRFEIPHYVFPEAADLIRRMLVVEVDQRITMQDILSHPFLRHTTPAILYVPAPSISELDRPLRSRAFVKQDLLSSLLVICAGASYEEVVTELLSPPGHGSLTKALYYLLAKHRERTLEEYGTEALILDEEQRIRHYNAPPLKKKRLPLTDTTTASPVISSEIRASRLAPAPPTCQSPVPAASPDPTSSTRSRPSSPLGPRSPRPSHQRPISSPNATPWTVHRIPENASLITGSRSSTRPPRQRTKTLDGLPVFRQRPDAEYAPSEQFFPGSPRPAHDAPPVFDVTLPAGQPVTGGDMSWLIKPTVKNPAVQRAIDDLAGRFSEVLSRDGKISEIASGHNASASAVDARSSPKKFKIGSKVTAQGESSSPQHDFRYTLPNKKTTNLVSAERNGGHDKENQEEQRHNVSVVSSVASGEDGSYMKIDVERDVNSSLNVTQKAGKGEHSSFCVQYCTPNMASYLAYTGPAQASSLDSLARPDHRAIRDSVSSTPAVVGEVKGWFANLFNWKAQQYVLYSVDNCLATRDEVVRLLSHFGCQVILEDAQSWGVLKCRMDEIHGTLGSSLSRVKFLN